MSLTEVRARRAKGVEIELPSTECTRERLAHLQSLLRRSGIVGIATPI